MTATTCVCIDDRLQVVVMMMHLHWGQVVLDDSGPSLKVIVCGELPLAEFY